MDELLFDWINDNESRLSEWGISIDKIFYGELDYCEISMHYRHYLVSISATKTGKLRAEIFDTNIGENRFDFSDVMIINKFELDGFLICFIWILFF